MPKGHANIWEPTDLDMKNAEKLGGYLKQDQLALFYGCTVSQLRGAFKRHPELRIRYDKADSAVKAEVAQALVQKALDGHVTAMIFYLKTQAGWWDTQKIEHTKPGSDEDAETAEKARRDVMERLAGIAGRIESTEDPDGADGRRRGSVEGAEVGVDVLGEAGPATA